MYLPLSVEELETQSYTAPPRGVPISQPAQAGPEGLGCIRRCVGRSLKFNQTRTHTNHPYPPYDAGRTRVSPTLCGEELEVQSIPTSPYTPNGGGMSTGTPLYPPVCGEYLKTQLYTAPLQGVPIPQTAHAGPEGFGCIRRSVGRSWKLKHTRPPHRPSLSPERPRQYPWESGVFAAI